MIDQVSIDEFEGLGPSFEKELENKLGNNVVAEAMKIIEHPELHAPKPKTKKATKAISRTYDLSDDKDRKQYERDVVKIMTGDVLLLDRPPKQFVSDGQKFKYVAYLEWAEYEDIKDDAASTKSRQSKQKPCKPAS